MKALAFLAVLLPVAAAAQSNKPLIYGPKIPTVLVQAVAACKDKSAFDDIEKIASDRQAQAAYLLDRIRAGACKVIPAGSTVFVIDEGIWSGFAQIRPQGDYREWYASNAKVLNLKP